MLLREAASGGQSVHLGHDKIHHRDVRSMLVPGLNGAATVFRFTHDGPTVRLLQHISKVSPHYRVVFDQEYSDHGHLPRYTAGAGHRLTGKSRLSYIEPIVITEAKLYSWNLTNVINSSQFDISDD